jgi:chemotaxis protein methyltransferase CheR
MTAVQRAVAKRDGGVAPVPDAPREFELSEADFRSLAKYAYDKSGITLSDGKRNLVYSRLSRRLRALGMASFREYRDYLTGENGDQEIENFINSISTNHTKFFREDHHFDHLRSQVIAPFAQAARGKRGARFRVWSAGCSSGEEPYTIAVVAAREIPDLLAQDLRILATDIDTQVLTKAAAGEYPAASVDQVPSAYRKYFLPKNGKSSETVVIDRSVRSLIAFRRLNLIQDWPFKGPFDVIFCRNVMIYFDNETKTGLVDRYVKMLKPGGFLYLGHSESLIGAHADLKAVGRTIYRKAP